MEITGYKIRESLRQWQLRRDTAAGQFNGTLLSFEGEKKPTPASIAESVTVAETAIARLQVAQTRYNLAVMVQVGGRPVTLLECIKRLGGLGRIEKMWRSAATIKENRYFDGTTRDVNQLVAERTISYEDAVKETAALDRTLGGLREAVAVGNARPIEIEDLDATLFE